MALDAAVTLVAVTLAAAFVNGALGYGFSSLTVPIALLFLTSRILNPALVLVELVINVVVLVMNREGIRAIWPRVSWMLVALPPGVLVGSHVLASVHPTWIKGTTYALLLPLILVQAAGLRRPIRSETAVALPFGAGLGFLYSITTISGPPLAVLFNNQGLVKREFRSALALIRVAESGLTAVVYFHLGLFSATSLGIAGLVLPSVLIGLPLGAVMIGRMDPEMFRRICMSFDVYVVGFGLTRALIELSLVGSPTAYAVMASAVAVDTWLLRTFFRRRAVGIENHPSLRPRSADLAAAAVLAEARDLRPSRLGRLRNLPHS